MQKDTTKLGQDLLAALGLSVNDHIVRLQIDVRPQVLPQLVVTKVLVDENDEFVLTEDKTAIEAINEVYAITDIEPLLSALELQRLA